MLMEAFVSLPSAEGAIQERNGSLMLNYSHLFDYHHENHTTNPGRASSNWTPEEMRPPSLLFKECMASISKSLFSLLGASRPSASIRQRMGIREDFAGCVCVCVGGG